MTAVQDSSPERSSSVARSTMIVMGGFATSIGIGLLRQRVIAVRFGTGAELDAYTAANGIPELLFTILAGGALGFAFVPILTDYLERDDKAGSRGLFSSVINVVLLLALVASGLTALGAPTLVTSPWGIAPDFPAEVQRLTWQLMRILLLSTIIFAVSSILTSALHAHQHFLLPALAPSAYAGGIIFGAVALSPSLGVFGLAWGAVVGAALHFLVQVPGVIHHGVRWGLIINLRSPALRRVGYLMAPRVADLFMARLSIDWINSNIGSGLGEGRVSALRYAYQLMNMPWTLIGTAIGVAVFPTLAVFATRIDVDAQREALSGALRAILTLAIPSAVALVVLGTPAIRLLYEGGEFTDESTRLVYFALQFYALTLLSQSVLEVVVRAFAAQKDTVTPLIVSVFTTALNIALAFWLSRSISEGGFEHGGLALANGIAVGIEGLIGLTILHIRWGGINARRIVIDAAKASAAAAVMGGVILGLQRLITTSGMIFVIVATLLGGIVYFGLAYLFGIRAILTVPRSVVVHMLGRRPKEALQDVG